MKTFEQSGVTYGVVKVPKNAQSFFMSESKIGGKEDVLGWKEKLPDTKTAHDIYKYDYRQLPDTHTYSIVGIVKELTEAQCAELVYVGHIYDTTNTDKTYKLALQMLLQVVLGFNPDDNILILKVENK